MKGFKIFLVMSLLLLALGVSSVMAQVHAEASTSGFGAAFGYAQTIGSMAYVQTGGIGNADATAWASTLSYYADSGVWTNGNASAFSGAFASPFGKEAIVQLSSFTSGWAMASASAGS